MTVVKTAACGCSKGAVRANNEDNFYFAGDILAENNDALRNVRTNTTEAANACYAVFDGIGGEADGQTASFMAADLFGRVCEKITEEDEFADSFLENTAIRMNDAVYREAAGRNSRMGCTAVMLGFSGERFLVCNVGDSRAYRFSTGELVQLTIDHSLPGRGGRKGPLIQCIGMPTDEVRIVPYKVSGVIRDGDLFLLCSDGLTDMVSDDEIAGILAGAESVSAAAEMLIRAALDHGGRDNVTVIVVRTER